jgi:hypothetical protein
VTDTDRPRKGLSKGRVIGLIIAPVCVIAAIVAYIIFDRNQDAEYARDKAAFSAAVKGAGWELVSEPHPAMAWKSDTGWLYSSVKFGDCTLQIDADPEEPTNVRLRLLEANARVSADIPLRDMPPERLKQNAGHYKLEHCIRPTG